MDELTPIEPEYREIPPEQPPQIPYYYGTGVQPPQKKSKLPLVLTLLTALMTLNLVTVAISLFPVKDPVEHPEPLDEPLLPAADEDFRGGSPKEDHGTRLPGEDMILKGIYDLYAPSSVVVTSGRYSATGVILTSDGYLLTDAEVAGALDELNVRLYDGTSCQATFVGVDEANETAILKIERDNLTTVTLTPELAERTQKILEDILAGSQSPATLHMDISELPDPIRIYWGLPKGVFIDRLLPNSNAYLAGLRPGDVLLQIGRMTITSIGDYLEALSLHNAGETVRIYLYRAGITYYTDVCLDAE